MTVTGPDLTGARLAIEKLMDDKCRIVRDVEGDLDDVLDEDTGLLAGPFGDTGIIYDDTTLGDAGRDLDGRCTVTPADRVPRIVESAGEPVMVQQYQASLPWDAPVIREGDTLEVTASRRDAQLVGVTLVVIEVFKTTYLISRKLLLEDRDRARHQV